MRKYIFSKVFFTLNTNTKTMQRAFVTFAVLAGAFALSHAFFFPLTAPAADPWDPLPANYQTLAATEKLKLLWDQVKATEYKTLPSWAGQGFAQFLKTIKVFFDLKASMDYVSDIMPVGRPKAIHTYGVVGQIEWVPVAGAAVKYTGLFTSGATGVARLSLGADPKVQGYLPGVAIKLLRDGLPSANFVSNNDLDGQGTNANFFAYQTRTWLPNPTGFVNKAVFVIFALTERDPAMLPVRDLALYDKTGKAVDAPTFPNMLILIPDDRVKTIIPADTTQDIRDLMVKIPAGPLYKVFKADSLTDPSPVHIADINLVGETLRASAFGDAKLFFQHQRKQK